MKKIAPFVALCMIFCVDAWATLASGGARRAMSGQMMAAPRTTASVNQLTAAATVAGASAPVVTVEKPSVKVENYGSVEPAPRDMRDKEKAACVNNNIGIGNTFVWASRFSNTNNYASMVEDTENPENNVCFVRVELRSDDGRVDVSDLSGKYFEWGQNITCGSWVDRNMLEKRILAAKKSGRTWGTVAGAVGGAAVGVGAMELFGNKLIGGAVQGQYQFEEGSMELIRSQMLDYKKNDRASYDSFVRQLKILRDECEKDIWRDSTEKPDGCNVQYDVLLSLDTAN